MFNYLKSPSTCVAHWPPWKTNMRFENLKSFGIITVSIYDSFQVGSSFDALKKIGCGDFSDPFRVMAVPLLRLQPLVQTRELSLNWKLVFNLSTSSRTSKEAVGCGKDSSSSPSISRQDLRHNQFCRSPKPVNIMSAFEIFAHTAFSSNYERMMGNCSRIVAAELVRIVRITSSSYVLDNACGPGIVSEQVKLLEPSAKILATDFALPMLEEMKKRIMAEKWENVETDQMDTRDLSRLADNTFTHVLTNFGAFMPGDKSVTLTAIKEMYRVVQIGGVAILSLWAGKVLYGCRCRNDC